MSHDVTADFALRLPDEAVAGASQEEEWCEVEHDGETRRIRFHDYADIYSIPGLYERLIYERLQCESPRVVARTLAEELELRSIDPSSLRVLDLGAGNGIVAQELAEIGVERLVGIDIIEAAAAAAERDRPGLYDDYLVANLEELDGTDEARLSEQRLNALVCVAALGFGDIPPSVFCAALRQVSTPAMVAFTIKDSFLAEDDPSGFSQLIDSLVADGKLRVLARERYRHRLSWAGEPLHYFAVLAEKRADP